MMESSSTRRETGSCSKEQPTTTLNAVKLSLVCQSSYRKPDLESHLRESELQKHKLMDPVKNLQDKKCQKHDRPLMLFCRDDQTCVCFICTVTDHKNHDTVPLREFKLQEITENQRGAQKHNKDVIEDLKEEITELKKRNTELEMVTQKQITAQRQNEDVIKDLKKEITELKKRNTEQQQKISNTEDNLLLIQEEHQKDLSRQQKSSSERSFRFWFLVVGLVLFVLSACFIQIHIQRPEAERLEATKTEIIELKKRNNELVLEMQRREAEITELKKRNSELDSDMQRREAETSKSLQSLKSQITELKNRNSELNSDMQLCKAEKTELKKKNSELESQLKFCKAGKTSERPQPSENVSMFSLLIGVLLVWFMVKCCIQSQDITELKKRNNELNLDIQRHEDDITELKEKNYYHKAELKLKKPWWDLF